MRLVIDMQGAQSAGSRHRGIGRYTLALCKSMARLSGEHEVILALNGLFPDTIEPLRAAFEGLLPQEQIRVWDAVGPVDAGKPAHDSRRHAMELIREAFLASLQPDVVLVTSLIEVGSDTVTSIGSFARQVPTAVILYDLIPWIHRDIYLQNPVTERWYLNKLDHLRRADLLLSISASSRQEAIEHLGFPPARVVNISTACDSQFRRIEVDERARAHLRDAFGLKRPFVMYTGGIDHRKNIEGLIRAYASLPRRIRDAHQLAVVCTVQAPDRKRLQSLARRAGLDADELAMTGFVAEEDLVTLYNACSLFVFPSWHEGFGLPALEAMACGRAVIGANTSSVPEVIGREDALFDPHDDAAIAQKIAEVLTNAEFRSELERHGVARAAAFSWEKTAARAWKALEAFAAASEQPAAIPDPDASPDRPRLAYVSPLPPEQSGISDYSAELLPELARHFDIEVIVAQREVSDPWIRANCPIRDVAWFRQNAHLFERVMYHFGNSHFHSHMFDLVREIPGVVVLHDFFLSGIIAHLELHGIRPHGWARALFQGHGWQALQCRHGAQDPVDAILAYPCNLEVIQNAHGVIVHSEHSRRMARDWLGAEAVADWSLIPLLRAPPVGPERMMARRALKLADDDIVVCSFGILGPTKLNHRLLAAWLASPLAADRRCRLVFVGKNDGGAYGDRLAQRIKKSPAAGRIEITGWTDAERYRAWLAAADIGVQLRTLSRGETSAAVLDCMNYGMATIVNANGSFADLPAEGVSMLPDEFSDRELIESLTILAADEGRRRAIGELAGEFIRTRHQPPQCAEQYAQAIGRYYRAAAAGLPALVGALADIEPTLPDDDWSRAAVALANNHPPRPRRRQLLLDISGLVQDDAAGRPARPIRALLEELLRRAPAAWALEPVFAAADAPGYRYARRYTSRLLGLDAGWAADDAAEAWPGDIFLGLDWQPVVVPAQQDQLLGWHRRGIRVWFVACNMAQAPDPRTIAGESGTTHARWLETISRFDGAICMSRAIADAFEGWLRVHRATGERTFALRRFHDDAAGETGRPATGPDTDAGQVAAGDSAWGSGDLPPPDWRDSATQLLAQVLPAQSPTKILV